MDGKRLDKVVISFSKYGSGPEDELSFLKLCGARYRFLGEKHKGFLRYYAIAEMTIPDEVPIIKDGSFWMLHEPGKGATIYIEWGEYASKRLAELNRQRDEV